MEDEHNFKCKLCYNRYRYEGTLKTHIMVEHCKSNSYNCDQCEYHKSSIEDTKTFKDPSNEKQKVRGTEELPIESNESENSPKKKKVNSLKVLTEESSLVDLEEFSVPSGHLGGAFLFLIAGIFVVNWGIIYVLSEDYKLELRSPKA